MLEQWTWVQLGTHRKPCALLNVGGYFDPLLRMIENMVANGSLSPEYQRMLTVDSEIERIMAPYRIRVTTGVELTARDAPSSFEQIDAAVPLARGVAEFGAAVGPVWLGARPTLPDSLPMIGTAPRHAGLGLAFGQQHIGFATGPATGDAIAAMICHTLPSFDTAPFGIERPVGGAPATIRDAPKRGQNPKAFHSRFRAPDPGD